MPCHNLFLPHDEVPGCLLGFICHSCLPLWPQSCGKYGASRTQRRVPLKLMILRIIFWSLKKKKKKEQKIIFSQLNGTAQVSSLASPFHDFLLSFLFLLTCRHRQMNNTILMCLLVWNNLRQTNISQIENCQLRSVTASIMASYYISAVELLGRHLFLFISTAQTLPTSILTMVVPFWLFLFIWNYL